MTTGWGRGDRGPSLRSRWTWPRATASRPKNTIASSGASAGSPPSPSSASSPPSGPSTAPTSTRASSCARCPPARPTCCRGPVRTRASWTWGAISRSTFKIESHNHPSFIEPFQGAATGVGGILRDIFTMGARPIAVLDSLRFGDPADPRQRRLIEGVVSGIGWYGNCFGVPNLGGEVGFAPEYAGNPLVNAMAVGLVTKRRHLPRARRGGGQSGVLRRRQDRPRRHPRRHHGLRHLRRERGGAAAHRAGRRPVHREAAARGLPRGHGHRRHRGHPGHGGGRASPAPARRCPRARAWAWRSRRRGCRSARRG